MLSSMANDCAMLEVSSGFNGVADEEEEEEDGGEIELSLELSIGGSYGKSEKSKPERINFKTLLCSNHEIDADLGANHRTVTGSGGSSISASGDTGVVSVAVDPHRKHEIHALRRQEARKKREEKLKKLLCRGTNGSVINGGASTSLNRKVWLEMQQFQDRVRDRENRENDEVDLLHKEKTAEGMGEKFVTNEDVKDLNLSLNHDGDNGLNATAPGPSSSIPVVAAYQEQRFQYVPFANSFLYPCVMPCWAPTASAKAGNERKQGGNVHQAQPGASRSFRPYQGGGNQSSVNNSPAGCDSENIDARNGENMKLRPIGSSIGRSYSAFSDDQSTSPQGGSSSGGTGSHSSNCQQQHQMDSGGRYQSDPSEKCVSFRRMESEDQDLNRTTSYCTVNEISSSIPHSSLQDSQHDKISMPGLVSHNSIPAAAAAPASEIKGVLCNKPPRPQMSTNKENNSLLLPQMPCVSATGNGPNGKTVTGFLYRYTKTEVTIVCVCHGTSFSPAEFVEHAGGVDISHPLRHITVIPSAFGL